ncbi:hypothetical protein ACWCRD_02625 [Streptomyces sp. NPDC002092]
MNPDLYGAWLTASTNLQPVGAWLAANWGWLTAAIAAAAFAAYTIRRAVRRASRTVDQILAEPSAEQQQPGTDSGLLLDCIAIYSDREDLQRLRDAINQARKGEK